MARRADQEANRSAVSTTACPAQRRTMRALADPAAGGALRTSHEIMVGRNPYKVNSKSRLYNRKYLSTRVPTRRGPKDRGFRAGRFPRSPPRACHGLGDLPALRLLHPKLPEPGNRAQGPKCVLRCGYSTKVHT